MNRPLIPLSAAFAAGTCLARWGAWEARPFLVPLLVLAAVIPLTQKRNFFWGFLITGFFLLGALAEAEKISLRVGELEIDEANFEARLKGKPVELTKIEFSLLAELLKAKGRLLTRDHLLEKIWGFDSYGDSRTIDTHLSRLRQKIGKTGERIETVRGMGYRFK